MSKISSRTCHISCSSKTDWILVYLVALFCCWCFCVSCLDVTICGTWQLGWCNWCKSHSASKTWLQGALCSSDSPWGGKGSCLREACGHVEEHQIIVFAGRDDGAGLVLQWWHQTSGSSCPSSWAHGSCRLQQSWAMAESGFTRWSQIAPPDLGLAPGHHSMVIPHHIVVLNSDHTRPEEGPWPRAVSDAHAKLSPTGSVVNCCVHSPQHSP